LGLHYYCGSTGQQVANEYTENEWYDLLERANRMETLVEDHWQVMGEFDRERRVKLAVDEWGAWHKQDSDVPPGYLYAYAGTLRDALVSAINLDIFQRHADKIVMSNPAQLVNTIIRCSTHTRTSSSLRRTITCSKCICRTRVRRRFVRSSFRRRLGSRVSTHSERKCLRVFGDSADRLR
jgi:alpha-L-arabinofuranosidase